MINEIIDLINCGYDDVHENATILGLVQKIYRQSGEGVEFLPGIVDKDGEAVYAGIDDVDSITIYHKANAGSLSFTPRGGYGDSRQNEDSISFSLIATWDTRKINMHPVDMLLLLRSRLPQEIRGIQGIELIKILPSAALLNTMQIFQSEYSLNENYILPVFINMLQINYTMAFKYDQQCIEQCINCKN